MSTLSAAGKKEKQKLKCFLDESVVQDPGTRTKKEPKREFFFLPKPHKKKEKSARKKMANRGSVYCIANDAMPGIVKIGATVRDPTDRLSDARAVTGGGLRRASESSVDDAFATERALHALLAARRFEARREFFTLTHDEARALFDTVARVAVGAHHAPRVAPAHQAVSARVARVAEVPVSYAEQLRAWVESKLHAHSAARKKTPGRSSSRCSLRTPQLLRRCMRRCSAETSLLQC